MSETIERIARAIDPEAFKKVVPDGQEYHYIGRCAHARRMAGEMIEKTGAAIWYSQSAAIKRDDTDRLNKYEWDDDRLPVAVWEGFRRDAVAAIDVVIGMVHVMTMGDVKGGKP